MRSATIALAFAAVGLAMGGCSTALTQPVQYTNLSAGQHHKLTRLSTHTYRAMKAACGSYDEVGFGADGEATIKKPVCRGISEKPQES